MCQRLNIKLNNLAGFIRNEIDRILYLTKLKKYNKQKDEIWTNYGLKHIIYKNL